MFLNLSKKLILGSNSPRRKEILQGAGFQFDVEVRETNEEFSSQMNPKEVPVFLAQNKVSQFKGNYENDIVLCADTVVILNNQIMNKPQDRAEALVMLEALNGKKHSVVSGVAIKVGQEIISFADECEVSFKKMSALELRYYVDNYKPFDKAGAYGIQEYLGMVGIEKLTGSYYTVMGLPIHKVYDALKPWIKF